MSFKSFYEALLEKQGKKKSPTEKGFFDRCIINNKDKDNPEAYCAGIKDIAWKSTKWRGKDKTKKETIKDVKKDLKQKL